jgi:hypothetical protein
MRNTDFLPFHLPRPPKHEPRPYLIKDKSPFNKLTIRGPVATWNSGETSDACAITPVGLFPGKKKRKYGRDLMGHLPNEVAGATAELRERYIIE